MDDADLLSDLARRLPAAREAIDRHIGNIPSAAGSTRASGTSDRTGSMACKLLSSVDADVAWRDDKELDRLERIVIHQARTGQAITRTLDSMLVIVNRWNPEPKRKRMLDEGLRAASDDRLNVTTHNNCQSHLRIGAIVAARTEGSRLCRWCEDWVRALNDPDGEWRMNVDMPTEQMVRANQDGRLLSRHLPPRHKLARS